MRRLTLPVLETTAVAVLMLFAACTSNPAGPQPVSAFQNSLARSEASSTQHSVYVSEINGSQISAIFGFNAQNRSNVLPNCEIKTLGYVSDIASDASGNLYAPGGAQVVKVFAPGCGRLLASIHDPFGEPEGAAIRGNTIYVFNSKGVAVCGLGGCSRELTDPSILQLTSAALDSSGDVWAAYYSMHGGPSLIEWRRAAMPGLVASGFGTPLSPGGILFDKNDMLIDIASHFSMASTYRCDTIEAKCVQTRAILLHGASNFGALNAENTDIQITAFQTGSVDVYAYPSFAYQYSYSRGLNGQNNDVKGITQAP